MTLTEQQRGLNLSPAAAEALEEAGPKCTKCIHSRTCIIYVSEIGIAKQFGDDKDGKSLAPFKAEDLAVICQLYQSNEGV